MCMRMCRGYNLGYKARAFLSLEKVKKQLVRQCCQFQKGSPGRKLGLRDSDLLQSVYF